MKCRVIRPCYIRVFEGEDYPRYYPHGAVVDYTREGDIPEKILAPIGGLGLDGESSSQPAGEPPAQPPVPIAKHESGKPHRIAQAASRLDRENDSHWTQQGQPRVDVVARLLGETVTREELKLACPALQR